MFFLSALSISEFLLFLSPLSLIQYLYLCLSFAHYGLSSFFLILHCVFPLSLYLTPLSLPLSTYITYLSAFSLSSVLCIFHLASYFVSKSNPLTSVYLHCKKELVVFPSPAGMSLIKLFLGGNN